MYFIIAYRTVILYILIVICYRIMGKKEVGELSIVDLIVSFSIAELASISIEEPNKSIFASILPIIILVVIEMTISYIGMKCDKFRKIVDGTPSIIINDGKINFKIMKKLRYTLDDLLTQIREKSIKSIEDVKYAVLETDGELSVFKDSNYPMPLIVDGIVDEETLVNINKDRIWIDEILKSKNLKIEDVYYAFYRDNNTYIIKKDELR